MMNAHRQFQHILIYLENITESLRGLSGRADV